MPGIPGPLELILLFVIVLMLFGVGKLSEVFGAVGKGIGELRRFSAGNVPQAVPPTRTENPASGALENR